MMNHGLAMNAAINGEMKSGVVLECRDLAYKYPNHKVVFQDINLLGHKDELIALVGPTGTGKSTLLRCLAYLIPPTHGQIYLNGEEVKYPSSQISLIHQSIATFPWMTALDNVKLALRSKKMEEEKARQISEKMLETVGLRGVENDYPKEMSGGMRQRIAIARALAAEPLVLLMDEPFVHLDEITANLLRQEIYSLVFNPDTTLKGAVLVSHNLHEVVQLADRVYIMNGSPATIVDCIKIDMPRPRSERESLFHDYMEQMMQELNIPQNRA